MCHKFKGTISSKDSNHSANVSSVATGRYASPVDAPQWDPEKQLPEN